jgi:hypothetical protein
MAPFEFLFVASGYHPARSNRSNQATRVRRDTIMKSDNFFILEAEPAYKPQVRKFGSFDDAPRGGMLHELEPPPAAIDWRLSGVGLNECERALNDCWPAVLDVATYSRLKRLGIHGAGINGRGLFDALQIADVIFRPDRRFEFSRDVGSSVGAVTAVIIPARDGGGDIVDLAAWNIESGAFGLWRGVASMLGEDWLLSPRVGDALDVFPTVTEWLRAGRQGVVVVDAKRARWALAGERIVATDVAFGLRLRDMLALPAAQIFVERAVA